jgi:adenosine deaminase/aminodeoxyfutalosine deaminase
MMANLKGTNHPDSASLLATLPKAELHLHLEGTITPATLVILSKRHDVNPFTLAQAEALYEYKDFLHFLQVWDTVCRRIQTPEDYALIVHNMFESLARQGVKHAEVFIAVGGMIAERPDIIVEDVFAAIEAARVKDEAKYGISVLWIIDASRQRGLSHVSKVFDVASKLRQKYPAVVGVGIGGDEVGGPCGPLRDAFEKAKQDGLRLTAHCGEATGPVNGPKEIWDALDMDVERLGHAFCAQYDESLLDELKKRGTVLELNVTSNVKTGVCQSVEDHPIRDFFRRGLTCTVNSDDPAMFGSNVLQEYVLLRDRLGFTIDDLASLAATSFQSSFLSFERKAYFVELVKAWTRNPESLR